MNFIFRNATLYDGSGADPVPNSDVLVSHDRITAIGTSLEANGAEEIDATGLALMPGIIDTHTHFDAQITWDSGVRPSPTLGVTTVVMGNCGFTIAPCKEADRDLVMKNLTQVEGMSLDALRAGIDWNFETFPEYVNMLRDKGVVPNVACFLGHSSIRTYVMGPAATERAATREEIDQMSAIVEQGMAAGAIGFATSTAPQHNGWGGVPMPSRLADDDELLALVQAMARSGRGIFMLTKGNRTDVPYLEELAKKTGRPIMIAALLHNSTNPTGTLDELARIADARARGQELWGQVSCCPLTMDFTLKSAYPLESFESWQPLMKLSGDDLKAKLKDPALRQAVKDELAQPAGVRLFNGEWHKIEITEAATDSYRALEHKTLAEIAEERGADPLDLMLDIAVDEDLETIFTAVLLNSDEDAVGKMLVHPAASVALSDAGAHLTFFCDAGFGLRLLGHWARDLGKMSMAAAVHELTGKPAGIYGIEGRGLVREGYAADLMLFDPETVGRGPKHRVFDLPAGAHRLSTDAVGVHGVWINGARVADQNGPVEHPNNTGEVLSGFAA
ncbi:MAG: amidohydrolase family protein [Rhodospirillales bacterium]|nr:amidohydrolase family protein [Rhodospirillales bacterium]MBO6785970.1 amidohydrolase family protein [Rhodospirillales bacterium]